MRTLGMLGASAIMLATGLVLAHLAVKQGELAYAAGAAVAGLSGLTFIGAALKGL